MLWHVSARAQESIGGIEGVVDGSPSGTMQVRAVADFVTVTADVAADGSFTFSDLPLAVYEVQLINATGRILAATRVRLTPRAPTQNVTLKVRPPLAALGGAVEEAPTFQAGPVGVTPSLALLDLGVDTNVFNETVDPKSDRAFAMLPDAVVTLDANQVRGQGTFGGQYLYFDKYAEERSSNFAAQGGLEVTRARFTPWAAADLDAGRRRINHEIDLRARQFTSGVRAGVDARVAGRTVVTLGIGRRDYGFDPGEVFGGSNL